MKAALRGEKHALPVANRQVCVRQKEIKLTTDDQNHLVRQQQVPPLDQGGIENQKRDRRIVTGDEGAYMLDHTLDAFLKKIPDSRGAD